MESEKVKEIKIALEFNANEDIYVLPYVDDNDEQNIVDFNDILTLINELESENERLERRNENLINKRYEEFENFGIQWENDENNKKRKTNKYLKNFSMELWLYYQQQYTNNQQLKHRIAELENTDYYKEIEKKKEDLLCKEYGLIKHEKEIVGKYLKQFAERLKEKMGVREYMGVKYKQGVFSENDIDETLKEFIK